MIATIGALLMPVGMDSSLSAGRMPPFEDKENRPASSVCGLLTGVVQFLRPRHSVRDRHGCLMAQAVTRNLL